MKEEPISVMEQAEQYVKTNAELYTLRFTGKMATVISSIFSRLIIGMLVFIVLFMGSMGMALWIGDLVGQAYAGYLIVAGSIALLTIILYVFRSTIIRKPIMNNIVSQILNEHHHV
jgi:hypothetical protein